MKCLRTKILVFHAFKNEGTKIRLTRYSENTTISFRAPFFPIQRHQTVLKFVLYYITSILKKAAEVGLFSKGYPGRMPLHDDRYIFVSLSHSLFSTFPCDTQTSQPFTITQYLLEYTAGPNKKQRSQPPPVTGSPSYPAHSSLAL